MSTPRYGNSTIDCKEFCRSGNVENPYFNHTSLFRFARAVDHENGWAMHQYGLILEYFREMIRVEPQTRLLGSVLISSVSCSIFEDRRNYLIL